MIFEEGRNPAKWEQIRTDDFYATTREQLSCWYDKYCGEEMENLPYSVFMQYHKVGNRVNYEHLYFKHRARLAAAFLNYMIYRTEEYKTGLADTVWGICDEYTWCLSAHIKDYRALNTSERYRIDLFAAETGLALAEIKALAPEAFDEIVGERIHIELEKRIIEPYLKNDYYWEHWAENWNAVCTGSVAMCVMYEFPHLAEKLEKRWLDATEIFLSEFGSDGCCTEGQSYWTYGFGFFVYFAAAYRQFTNGRIDFFKRDIVKKTAQFQQNMFLATKDVVCFADCEDYAVCLAGLTGFLSGEYSEVMSPVSGTTILNYENNECFSLVPLVRNLVWGNTHANGSAPGFYYYDHAQWYIRNTDFYSFAAKCGNNDEAHNHNDVGAFMLSGADGKIVIDMGSGVYDKDYFSENGRYKIINCSSLGHSVPIVNNKAQSVGGEYRGSVTLADKNRFYMDIAGAYDSDIKKLERRFELADNTIKLTDSFDGKLTERIILSHKPEQIGDGEYLLGSAVIKLKNTDAVFGDMEYYSHDGTKRLCCAMDIAAENEFSVEFVFKNVINK